MTFVHLHVHSMYSLLEASCRTKELAKKAKEMGMPAVALTDNGNMFGAIEFYNACQAEGVKPILGLDAFIAPGSRFVKGEDRSKISKPNRRIVLLAKSFKGYQSLCRISSIGYQEGFYYKPRIDYEVLEENAEDLIALSGGFMGDIGFTFREEGEQAAIELIKKYQNIYGENFYLELCRTGKPEWKEMNAFFQKAGKELGVPLVASNDVHYLYQEESLAQEVLLCIGMNKTLSDESRFRLGSDEFYFKTQEQMQKLFQDIPEAVENTLKIAEQCNVEFQLTDADGKRIYHLPDYPTTDGNTLKEEIESMSRKGLEERFSQMRDLGKEVTEEMRQQYNQRLNYELGIIDSMGFNGYFLIVADFIKWAKEHDCPVGPGRGSGAGSLVAYSLMITDLDPMPYNLIFERFLNPERVSMPDFDIDFCQERRASVIDYVTEKYGQESVSQIITFGKLQARAAIRDVGRVLGMTVPEVNEVVDLIPDRLGISLKEAIAEEKRLQEWMEADPKISTLMELSQKVEGLTRHASIHAAGVIISNKPLVEYAPLYKGAADENVVQYDMKNAEGIGLIKFDFLGLKTLTMIDDALKLVASNRKKKYQPTDIDLNDPGVYEVFCEGDLDGVFQFEGAGISEFSKRVKPTCFEDITAINALYRPGPMQFLDEYKGRKHGEIKVTYLFEELEPILQETYGIIVYQEHVQLIAAKIASYSLGEADLLRRAMGKKIAAEMEKQKDRFVSGAVKNGFDKEKAIQLFEQMAKFAEYGFNKSHAAAYCVLAAQTAWLKRYYPVEFYAALLSTEMSNTDKVVQYVKDARNHGIEVRAPHVNYSNSKFSVVEDTVFFGLGAIKGVGESAVEAILEARERKENKSFQDLEDFFQSIDTRRVNKKVIECLIKSGALDDFGATRSQLAAVYSLMLDRAEKKRKDEEIGQASLFALDTAEKEDFQLPKVPKWSKAFRLAAEKEVLGFYLSDHPLAGLEKVIRPYTSHQIADLYELKEKTKVSIGGLLASHKEFITKKGTRMSFSALEDLSGKIEIIVFPNTYAECEELLKQDIPLFISGNLEIDEKGHKIIAESILPLEVKWKQAKNMTIQIKPEDMDHLEDMQEIFRSHPGTTKVNLEIQYPDLKHRVRMQINEPEGVDTNPDFLDRLASLQGSLDAVHIH